MTHLLARIMLALLMLPIGAMVYVLTVVVMFSAIGYSGQVVPFVVADLLTGAFVAVYWTILWRRTVRWTPQRLALTLGAVVVAAVGGLITGAIGSIVDPGFSVFVGGVTAILLWLVFTVLIWRDTHRERIERDVASSA
jgi:fucose permease